MLGVGVIGRLDHIVLLIAAQTVLRAKGGGQFKRRNFCQGIQCVIQRWRDRSRMRQKRNTSAFEFVL